MGVDKVRSSNEVHSSTGCETGDVVYVARLGKVYLRVGLTYVGRLICEPQGRGRTGN